MQNKHHVFVYGTLKAGLSNHILLKSADFVGRGMTIKPYMMCDTGGFPVVFQEADLHNVLGEVYEVDEQTLKRLDRLEGHPDMFERRQVTVDIDDSGVQQSCWMYFGNQDHWKHYIANLERVKPQSNGAYAWRV